VSAIAVEPLEAEDAIAVVVIVIEAEDVTATGEVGGDTPVAGEVDGDTPVAREVDGDTPVVLVVVGALNGVVVVVVVVVVVESVVVVVGVGAAVPGEFAVVGALVAAVAAVVVVAEDRKDTRMRTQSMKSVAMVALLSSAPAKETTKLFTNATVKPSVCVTVLEVHGDVGVVVDVPIVMNRSICPTPPRRWISTVTKVTLSRGSRFASN